MHRRERRWRRLLCSLFLCRTIVLFGGYMRVSNCNPVQLQEDEQQCRKAGALQSRQTTHPDFAVRILKRLSF